MVSSRDTKLIFERLIGRLLDGMIVPFIGAGVSYDAKHRGCIADLTRTSSMAGRVFVALLKKCQTRQDARCSTCVVRTEIESSLETGKEISFDKACELWEWSCPGFQAVFWRLLRLACGRESAVVSFLLPVLPCASSLLVDTINWFAPQNAPDHICGRFPEMLELAEDEDKVIPLARWVERVRTIQPQIWRGLYHPLAERPVLIPAVLLLIYLMIGTYQLDRSDISWKELKAMIRDDASPLGLSVEGCYVFGDVPVGVYIAHRNVAEQVLHKVVCHMPTELTVAIQIVLSPYGARKHRLYFACGEHNSVKVVTVRQVSILELFRQAASVPEADKRFRQTLRKTSLLSMPDGLGCARGRHRCGLGVTRMDEVLETLPVQGVCKQGSNGPGHGCRRCVIDWS